MFSKKWLFWVFLEEILLLRRKHTNSTKNSFLNSFSPWTIIMKKFTQRYAFEPLSRQTRPEWRKSLKSKLNCCKLVILFKSKSKLSKQFLCKGCIPKELTSVAVCQFHLGLCNKFCYIEFVRLCKSIKEFYQWRKRNLIQKIVLIAIIWFF